MIATQVKMDDRTNEYLLTTRGKQELEARREWETKFAGELAAAG